MTSESSRENRITLASPQEALARFSSTNRFARIVIEVLKKGAEWRDARVESFLRDDGKNTKKFRNLMRFDCEVPIGDSEQTAHVAIVNESTPKESIVMPIKDDVVDFFLSDKPGGHRGGPNFALITTSLDRISLPEFRFDLSSNFGRFVTDFVARLSVRLNEIREDISGEPNPKSFAEPNPS